MSMRFMSCPRRSGLPKSFSFDSSPGRAIGQALGAGTWDERSYRSELKETRPGNEEIYAVYMTRKPTSDAPNPREEKVGMITWTRPAYRR